MIWTACFTTRLRRRGSVEPRGPAQVLFERFAVELGLPVDRQIVGFQKIAAPTILSQCDCPIASACFSDRVVVSTAIAGKKRNRAAYQKVARYWRRLYSQRAAPAPASSPAQPGN